MVTVRNTTNEYRMVAGRLLWPGETRQVNPAIAATLPEGVEVVGREEPAGKAVVEEPAAVKVVEPKPKRKARK